MKQSARVIHRFSSVSSTQDEARRLLEAGEASLGHVVVADEQTAGRGRFGRSWTSPSGGLYATFLVSRAPGIALFAGVATARALERLGVAVGLKWPNDVLVDGKKLAGILIEADRDLALVGVGLNIDEPSVEGATSLRRIGVDARRGDLLLALLDEINTPADPGDVLAAYRARSATIGRRVKVLGRAGELVEGRAVDIDVEGRLVVETGAGTLHVSSGDCVHLEPAADAAQ
ncbi:MAG: biotin--[acetyl-CoA-carboxylase] ligase [Candidatus Bipolaricaulota bacterium]|nr:biotin--[acetyl-CoA-carboxylase] ligase [Candidatus Bipolaricaulota bacterium]